MHIDTSIDFAANYIQVKKLMRELEVDFNEKNYTGCLEKATMLTTYSRDLKTDLCYMLENKNRGS